MTTVPTNPEPARVPSLCVVGPCPRCGNFVTGVLAVGEPWPKHYERTVMQGCSHHGGAYPIDEELFDPAPSWWRAGDPPWPSAAASATTADTSGGLAHDAVSKMHALTCDHVATGGCDTFDADVTIVQKAIAAALAARDAELRQLREQHRAELRDAFYAGADIGQQDADFEEYAGAMFVDACERAAREAGQ